MVLTNYVSHMVVTQSTETQELSMKFGIPNPLLSGNSHSTLLIISHGFKTKQTHKSYGGLARAITTRRTVPLRYTHQLHILNWLRFSSLWHHPNQCNGWTGSTILSPLGMIPSGAASVRKVQWFLLKSTVRFCWEVCQPSLQPRLL